MSDCWYVPKTFVIALRFRLRIPARLRLASCAAGGQYAAETGANELAIVVLGGVCSVDDSAGKLAAYRRTQ